MDSQVNWLYVVWNSWDVKHMEAGTELVNMRSFDSWTMYEWTKCCIERAEMLNINYFFWGSLREGPTEEWTNVLIESLEMFKIIHNLRLMPLLSTLSKETETESVNMRIFDTTKEITSSLRLKFYVMLKWVFFSHYFLHVKIVGIFWAW